MYIKQVTIEGFKSYKDQTIVDPFSPRHNAIVGRNGSGKSNFFFAIRFVLSDMFSSMHAEERQSLLHEGTGPTTMSAFVEIVFENTDHRIPIDRDEVTLRRSIGLKKDEYFLDSKHIAKAEVVNLLESSGFSRSNPYYIVQQGKISKLAVAKDAERLELLKEVAGTSVYDERRKESEKILEQTAAKREQIEEVLGTIETRLQELEEEKAELQKYQELDRDKRSIEYTIYNKEFESTTAALKDIEEKKQRLVAANDTNLTASQENRERAQDLERELGRLEQALGEMETERSAIEQNKDKLLQDRASLEFEVQELKVALETRESQEDRLEHELSSIKQAIEEKEAELAELMPAYEQAVDEHRQTEQHLAECKLQHSELLSKQSRGRQFATVADRDAFLDAEIKGITESIKSQKKAGKKLTEELSKVQARLEEEEDEMAERVAAVDARQEKIAELNKSQSEHQERLRKANALRKELWRTEDELKKELSSVKSTTQQAEREILNTFSKRVAQGVTSVKRVAQDLGLGPDQGFYGPLLDLIVPADKMMLATEAAAGNSLMFVVVKTDAIASKLLEEMNKRKLPGRVTFLPLNRLKPKQHRYPKSNDGLPLIEQLRFDSMFEPAVRQVLGRTLVCRNLTLASKLGREYDLDGVTLDGDKVNRKGALTGGYMSRKTAKFESAAALREGLAKIDELQQTLDKHQQKLQETDQDVTRSMGELDSIKYQLLQLQSSFQHLKTDLESVQTVHKITVEAKNHKTQALETVKEELAKLEHTLDTYRQEKGTDLMSQLDEEDQDLLRRLSEEIATHQTQLMEKLSALTQYETKKSMLESVLEQNLRKKLSELSGQKQEMQFTDTRHQLAAVTKDLQNTKESLQDAAGRHEELVEMCASHVKKIDGLRSQLEEVRALESQRESEGQVSRKDLEKALTKRRMLLSKKEETGARMRELGTLPQGGVDKYSRESLKQLYAMLARVNKQLKKFSHVNKKALDQYVQFSDQREDLVKRKEEQDKADGAIRDLIDVLDNQKDAAIHRTFKQVSKYFEEVFDELVPGGKAQLIMQTRAKQALEDGVDETQDTPEESASSSGGHRRKRRRHAKIDNFTGVAIRVRFAGRQADTVMLQQLSGGQKTVVALALIFAIQRCDPAPFYLFDEIDSNLDPAHRTSVAALIHRQSHEAQFITTTFRPEMLVHADKCYGVIFRNKVSKINVVSRKQAEAFIDMDGKNH
eukprot:m.297760 g.297760  ORF g.297760 m.297760 type:complete len:1218 (-) comp19533_c0_seq1:144-3797(-)